MVEGKDKLGVPMKKCNINPFFPNVPFLYPLKTNHKVFCFQGVEKGFLGNEWVNMCYSGILKKPGNLKTPERSNLRLDKVSLEISGGLLFLQR